MKLVANLLVLAIALAHVGFLALEMFLWTKPLGQKIFRQSAEQATASATLAMNQGLYNGFLAAGLVWGLLHSDPNFGMQIKFFFLACVAVAGFFGGWSVNRRIFIVQGLPAIVTMICLALSFRL